MFLGCNLSAIFPLSTFTKYHLLAPQYPWWINPVETPKSDDVNCPERFTCSKKFSIRATLPKVAHPLGNCRSYYSQGTVDPQESIDYVQRNRNKKVIYRSFVTISYNKADLVIFNGNRHLMLAATTVPSLTNLSLTNLQASVGGQNVLQSTLNMTCEI